jgi:hypothetical protein
MENTVYCLKGHFVGIQNKVIRMSFRQMQRLMENPPEPEQLPRFCTKCGSENISACQHCQTQIGKQYPDSVPAYCGGCGKPFPWTETALVTAGEYTDALDTLNTDEKTELKGTFADLTSDTARTPVAISRFNKFLKKIGPSAGGILKEIIVSVASETVKKSIMG